MLRGAAGDHPHLGHGTGHRSEVRNRAGDVRRGIVYPTACRRTSEHLPASDAGMDEEGIRPSHARQTTRRAATRAMNDGNHQRRRASAANFYGDTNVRYT